MLQFAAPPWPVRAPVATKERNPLAGIVPTARRVSTRRHGVTVKFLSPPATVPTSAWRASNTRIRDLVKPFRGSVMRTPVFCSAVSTSVTVADGLACFSTAHVPATWGVAIEVPAMLANKSPGIEERIQRQGASSERNEALLEKLETASATVPSDPSSVEPTLIAVEMQPGALRALVKPSFPAAITVAIPTERRLSMATLRGSLSQLEKNCPPPRLMLTEANE